MSLKLWKPVFKTQSPCAASIDDLYDDLPASGSSFFVADVSSNSKRLLPVDIYRKRHHLLKQMRNRKNLHNNKQFSAPSITSIHGRGGFRSGGAVCNNRKLAKVMLSAMVDDVSISKRLVRKATELAFPAVGGDKRGSRKGKFDVLCAVSDFSYSIYAQQYCEATRGNVTCFAFI